jgi:hypothetical protein
MKAKIESSKHEEVTESDKLKYGPDPVKEQLEWKDDEYFVHTKQDELNEINNLITQRKAHEELNKRWLRDEIIPLREWLIKHRFIK